MKLPGGVSRISLAQHAELRSTGPPWEQTRRIRNAELSARYLGEERAKVGRDREIAPLVETLARQTGPAAVDLAAARRRRATAWPSRDRDRCRDCRSPRRFDRTPTSSARRRRTCDRRDPG